jgi:phosphatidylethanolamine/phosphatidyl-N-methylethanolamine N-methyltransferase
MGRTPVRFDSFHFFKSWIAAPLRVASVTPSSRSLARLMTLEISAATGPVLELGPGTGVFTKALLARGVDEADLTLIEYGHEFVPMLRHRFPRARVVQLDAAKLGQAAIFDGRPVGAVVSGLPLLSMPQGKVESIVEGALHHLRPGGALYQFTYGPRCPIPRSVVAKLGLDVTRIGRTLRNIPPATVYRFGRDV